MDRIPCVGDVVQLKSGSPVLTVTHVLGPGSNMLLRVSWLSSDGISTFEAPVNCFRDPRRVSPP